MFGVMNSATPTEQVVAYKSYEDLFANLSKGMACYGYKLVKARSHRRRLHGTELPTNDVIRVDLVCDRGGRPYRCHATKHKTTTKKTGCPWKAKAVNRKSAGGWVLTIVVDSHNHAPGTPEPALPSEEEENADADGEADALHGAHLMMHENTPPTPRRPDLQALDELAAPFTELYSATPLGNAEPRPAAEAASGLTSESEPTAMAVAGMAHEGLRLTGDTFYRLKQEYRKMSKPERFRTLSQFQLQIAAIYAVENEDLQRQQRQEMQTRQYGETEDSRSRESEQQNRERITAMGSDRILSTVKHHELADPHAHHMIPSPSPELSGPLMLTSMSSSPDFLEQQQPRSPQLIHQPHFQPHQQPQGMQQSHQQPQQSRQLHSQFEKSSVALSHFQQYALSVSADSNVMQSIHANPVTNTILHPPKRIRRQRPAEA